MKNVVTTLYVPLSFQTYFSNENILWKSKKMKHAFFSLLDSGVFVLVEKQTEKAVSLQKRVQVSKI